MPAKGSFGWIDGSGEKTHTLCYFDDSGLITVSALNIQVNLVRVALEALTDLNETRVTVNELAHSATPTLPSSDWAQREHGLRFSYADNVTGTIGRFDVPGVSEAGRRTSGTDVADLTITEIAAVKTAVEASCVSPLGNAITIIGARWYGKNN